MTWADVGEDLTLTLTPTLALTLALALILGDELIRSRGEAIAAEDEEKKLKEPARDDPRWTRKPHWTDKIWKLWGMLQRMAAPAMIIMILGRATQLSYRASTEGLSMVADLDESSFWQCVGAVAGGAGSVRAIKNSPGLVVYTGLFGLILPFGAAAVGMVASGVAAAATLTAGVSFAVRVPVMVMLNIVVYRSVLAMGGPEAADE